MEATKINYGIRIYHTQYLLHFTSKLKPTNLQNCSQHFVAFNILRQLSKHKMVATTTLK